MQSRPRIALFLVVVTLVMTLPTTPASTVPAPERFVVGFHDGLPASDEILGGRIVQRNAALGFAVVEGLDAAAARLDPRVRYVESDAPRPLLHLTPNDPQWSSQHAPSNVRLPLAWDVTTGSTAAAVCVVDTGARLSHQDLAASRYLGGYDFVDLDATPQDGHGHGTHVLGIAAASVNNALNIAGAGNVGYYVARVLDDHGEGSFSAVANGIQWCADRPSPRVVISMSLGCGAGSAGIAPRHGSGETCDSQPVRDAISNALAAGRLVVVSAGNDGACYSCVSFPARLEGVLAIGCSVSSGSPCIFSSWGRQLALVAPGDGVLSLGHTTDSATATLSGTSMSAPLVAGSAALYWSHDTSISGSALRERVRRSAQDVHSAGWDAATGCGRLDVKRLFDGTLSSCVIPPPPVCTGTPVNDCFENATILTQEYDDFVLTNVGAGDEVDEEHPCDLGRSVWFKFTAETTETAWVYPRYSPPRTSAAVYEATGPSIRDLSFLGCSDGFPTPAGPPHVEFTCVAGRTYYLQVGGNGGVTGSMKLFLDLCKTGPAPPSPPRDLVATGQNAIGAVSLTWKAPLDDGSRAIQSYTLDRAPAPSGTCPASGFTNVAVFDGSARAASESDLAPNATVCYRLIATNSMGPSAPVFATVWVPGLPEPPRAPFASGMVGQIRVTWLAPTHWGGLAPDAFHVYRASSASGPFDLLAEIPPTSVAYTDGGHAAGTTYWYRVAAANVVGEGARTAVVTATTARAPSAPTSVSAGPGTVPFSIRVSWSPPASDGGSAITAYEVFRDGTSLGEISRTARTFDDTGRGMFAHHNYTVRAHNAVGPGTPSASVCGESFFWPDAVSRGCP